MRISLDLTDLVAKGKLTQAEADRLRALAGEDAGALGVNILLGFGTVAVALAAGVLVPSVWTVLVIGGLLFALGVALRLAADTRWSLFAQICTTLGTLAVVSGVVTLSSGDVGIGLVTVILLAGAAVLAQSGLLAALAVLDLAAVLGASSAYWHASYGISIMQPTLAIGVLAVVALGLLALSLRFRTYERIAIIGARTATIMINVAFLVGSLFGDKTPYFELSDTVFSVVWAALLIGVGLWGVRAGRRWVVNAAAVFGGIHFYTQWFEQLGASPVSVLVAGVLLIGFGFALRAFNQRGKPVPTSA